jgi:hypothetical protein
MSRQLEWFIQSSVRINNPGIVFRCWIVGLEILLLLKTSRQNLRITQPPTQWVLEGCLPRGKKQWLKTDRSFTNIAGAKNAWS